MELVYTWVKRILILGALGTFCICMISFNGVLLISTDTIAEIQISVKEIKLTVSEVRGYVNALNTEMNAPSVKRGRELLLRSGDDLARTIKKTNVILDNLNDAISSITANINERAIPSFILAMGTTTDSINKTVLPEVATTLQETTKTIRASRESVQSTSIELSKALGGISKSVEGIEQRISNPAIGNSLVNIEQATAHANKSLEYIELKTQQLVKPVHWLWRGIKEAIVIIGRIFIP